MMKMIIVNMIIIISDDTAMGINRIDAAGKGSLWLARREPVRSKLIGNEKEDISIIKSIQTKSR